LADGVMDTGLECDAQLGTDAIRAGDQHRIAAAGQLKEAPERSQIRQHSGGERTSRQAADAANDLIARVDVDARLLVIHLRTRTPNAEPPNPEPSETREPQNSRTWISVSASLRCGDASGDCQYVCRTVAKKRSSSKSSSSMSNASRSSSALS